MSVNQSTSVELLLADRVEKQLRAAGIARPDRSFLLDCLIRVLYDSRLAAEEVEALVPDEAPRPDRVDAVDRFLAMRVERALQATLDAAWHSALGSPETPSSPPLAPRVVVHRSSLPSMREMQLESQSSAAVQSRNPLLSRAPLATARVSELSREGRGVLVLADGPAVYGLLDRHTDLKIGDQELGLHFRAGEGDALLTLGASDPSAVHVLEFEFALAHLENTLEHAIHGRSELPPELGDEKAALPAAVDAPGSNLQLLAAAPALPEVEPDPNDPMVGTLFDAKYLILRRIGKGGFGVVYEARDIRLDHRVAIKLLHSGATRSAEDLEAFKSEARRATRLSHPNIVDWKTFEQSGDGAWYFVMELLEGEELEDILKREGTLDARRTSRILLQILDALRAAHDVGSGQSVLHLDLKPKNVFLVAAHPGESEERVKVIDFGIGQFIGAQEAAGSPPSPSSPAEVVSDQGPVTESRGSPPGADPDEGKQTLLTVHTFETDGGEDARRSTDSSKDFQRSTACTPEYAAPEQCAHLLPELDAVPLDGRADLYALGVIGFQMLTGKLPFEKPARRKDLLHIKQSVEPRKAGSMGVRVPKRLAQFIDRCLSRHRDGRYRDANEAYEALWDVVHPPLRKSLLGAAGLVVLAAVAAAWLAGKRLAHQGFDLFTRIDGVERSLGGSRLYLGPARDRETIRVSGLDSLSELEGIRMVDSRDDHASEIPGFRVAPQPDGRLLVSAEGSPTRIQRPAYLEVRSFGRRPNWSVPFELVWIGEASWDLESVSVEGLGDRALDPSGALLAVRVRGESEDFSSVRVEYGDRTYGARRDEALSRGGEGVYRVPLEALHLEGDRAELRVLVTDKAARTREGAFAANLAAGALALTEASLDATAVGGRYSLSPRSEPELSVKTSRKSDLSWTVRDSNGAVLMKGSVQGIQSGRYPLTGLTRLRGGHSFSGSIEVAADEGAYVLHPGTGDRGVARSGLEFTFADTAPDLSVRVSTPGGGLGKTLDPSHPVFVSQRDLLVRVARENALPLRVQVVCAPAGSSGSAVELEPQLMVDREATQADFPIAVQDDGEYAVSVRVWRYDAPGKDAGRDPDSVSSGQVVVDTTPAKIAIQEPAQGIVLREKSDPLPHVEVQVQKEQGPTALTRTPVELRWDLLQTQRPGEPLASGLLGTAIPGGPPIVLEVPAPWSLGSKDLPTRDGSYRLVVSGVDAAGNTAVPATLPFDAAVDGPELELSRPPPRIHWPRGESGGFELQVVARDPNGVADVHGVVHRSGGSDIAFELHAAADARRTDVSVWSGTVPFDESWSNRAVEVRLVSTDGFGTTSELTEPRELGPVDHLLPTRVVVEFGDVPVEGLHLVEGNATFPYTFGGRVDAEEERSHAAAGLPPYNTLNTPRSWRVNFAPHDIPSFYLDEHEVSVGQYLAFVRADSGYASASWWPEGSSPDEARRRTIEHELSATSADLPVADLTWTEAVAYARWVGKRLPSLVEWEYAVRGGALYRPFAGARKTPRMPTREEVNYDPDGEGDGAPWPCTRGGDVTEDTGIYDLCGNVAEWTSTPASFLDGAATPLNLPTHALENRTFFLDPRRFARSERMERYWVAGGSFQSARSDFLTIDRRGRSWHGPAVGFRCAADVESARSESAGGSGRPKFRGLFE